MGSAEHPSKMRASAILLLILGLLAVTPFTAAYWDGVNDMPPSGRHDVDSDGDGLSDAMDDDDDNDGILDDHDNDDDGDASSITTRMMMVTVYRMTMMTMMIMTASLTERRMMTVTAWIMTRTTTMMEMASTTTMTHPMNCNFRTNNAYLCINLTSDLNLTTTAQRSISFLLSV